MLRCLAEVKWVRSPVLSRFYRGRCAYTLTGEGRRLLYRIWSGCQQGLIWSITLIVDRTRYCVCLCSCVYIPILAVEAMGVVIPKGIPKSVAGWKAGLWLSTLSSLCHFHWPPFASADLKEMQIFGPEGKSLLHRNDEQTRTSIFFDAGQNLEPF